MSERYAIYYVPPADSVLWRRGCEWLGRDPETGRRARAPRWLSLGDWHALVAEPTSYGLHATIKAPFRPADGIDAEDVVRHLAAFCRRYEPFSLPPLDLGSYHEHLVLEPRRPAPELDGLTLDCVHAFECLRAPEGDHDRRQWGRWARFTPRERELLRTLGYPHTAERFAFHITLTGWLERCRRRSIARALRRRFAPVLRRDDLPVNELAVFRQPHARACFELFRRVPLGATAPPSPD